MITTTNIWSKKECSNGKHRTYTESNMREDREEIDMGCTMQNHDSYKLNRPTYLLHLFDKILQFHYKNRKT